MLNIDPVGLRNLTRALRDQDNDPSFDRCNVSSDPCQQSSIEAHAVPRVALRLIARDKKVYSNHPHPPQNPLAYVNQNPLSERSIDQFSVGRWACQTHDRLFDPIDSNNIDFGNSRNLFLIIYRITLRMTHLLMRTVGRYVFPIMDPETPTPEGLSKDFAEETRKFIIEGTFNVMRLFTIQGKMQRFMSEEDYYKLDYSVLAWNTEPTIAGAGIFWCDGPSGKSTWSGSCTLLPCWYVVLPQIYGQAIITACPVGFRKYAHDLNRVAVGMNLRESKMDNGWTNIANLELLKSVVDLAVKPDTFESLRNEQTKALQAYLRTRSITSPHHWQLPNLLKLR